MRTAAKLDDNHKEVVSALRKAGCSVLSLASVGHGCPDLLVGRAGVNWLIEVKDGTKPPSKRTLTQEQRIFFAEWGGQAYVVKSVDEALKVLGLYSGYAD